MATTEMQRPSYDPTDAGNKPGDGPLRVGGVQPSRQEGGLAWSAAELPSIRSPESQDMLGPVGMVRAVWGGTRRLRQAGEVYLPRDPGETTRQYDNRLRKAILFNAFKRTVEGLVGLIFRRDPVLSEDMPDVIREDMDDVDLEGTHLAVFLKDLEEDALAAGHAGILVEHPKVESGLTMKDEQVRNIRPYWVPVKKENIISWRTKRIDGALKLLQLVLKETTTEAKGTFGTRQVTRYRVFRMNPKVAAGPAPAGNAEKARVWWELLRVTEKNEVMQEDKGSYPTLDEIPFVEVPTSGRMGLFESDPPLLDLAYLNIAHYQQYSDYQTCLHVSSAPIFFGKMLRQKKGPTGQAQEDIVLGPHSAIIAGSAEADAKYVSHDGASLASAEKALEKLEGNMGTLGLSMLTPDKRAAETATAKRMDKSTQEAPLTTTARMLEDAAARALYFHAQYRRLDDPGNIEINRDFEGLLMEAPVMRAFAELVKVGFPPRVVLQQLQATGRISKDADLEGLETEWLMTMEIQRVAEQEEREARQAAAAEDLGEE